MPDLLRTGLDAARIERENGKLRGQVYLDTVRVALDLAHRQRRMTSAHSLLFARLRTQHGLAAADALELPCDGVGPVSSLRISDPAAGDALRDGLFARLTGQVGGDPFALYTAHSESLPATPAEMRDQVVA